MFFLAFFVRLLVKDGYAYDAGTGVVSMASGKYLSNLLTMWPLAIVLLIGVVALLYGILLTWLKADYARGIWPAGIGTVSSFSSLSRDGMLRHTIPPTLTCRAH